MTNDSTNILMTSITRIAIKNRYAMSDLPTYCNCALSKNSGTRIIKNEKAKILFYLNKNTLLLSAQPI